MERLLDHVRPLPKGAVWYEDVFPWLTRLDEKADAFRRELTEYIEGGGAMPDKEDLSPGRVSRYGPDRWEFLHLLVYGQRIERISERFPETFDALAVMPNCCGAMFSRLPPESRRIMRHSDGRNGTLRVHVPLKVPAGGACYMRIGGQDVHWEVGRSFVMDASVEHEVFKDVAEERIILILDLLRPAPRWLRLLYQNMYPPVMGRVAQKVLQESYSKLTV
jgi:aspartyl/asparaginyl beta-hydroxylase (cupin superfamily)